MPELPEVETVARQLARAIVGKTVARVVVFAPKSVRGRPLTPLVGRAVTGVDRRAKLIRIACGEWTLLVHLKMTGRLLRLPAGHPTGPYTRAVFTFTDGTQLFFDDIRRFGYLMLLPSADAEAHFVREGYGPEPLAPDFDANALAACLARRPRARIKAALLDQTCIAGIGNIYADETLFAAGIRPTRPAGRITRAERAALWTAIRDILTRSIAARGSSSVNYRDTAGRSGNFVRFLQVYGRNGDPCPKGDGGVIHKTVVAGRGTHWCPKHQK
ncbi:bifunctional DNA-formamidopyrimidine glycosylase/DNA-(apurinic or apyrimidinic site) lyase [Patescibacteria group bacterium]|nr:MAG: bifunctional DNA-formamidopyrimidine glycosylase/DNA-(apurinic or apyrimidinic site) lyase [Patescibacteria group bacterium]